MPADVGSRTDSPLPAVATPIAGLAGLLLVATGLYGAAFWLSHDPGPPPDAIARAAAALRADYQAGDLIVLQPAYATRAREYLGDLHPLAVRDPLDEDIERHPRIWVFGLFGGAEALRPAFEASGMELAQTKAPAEGVVVDLWQTGGRDRVRYDFTKNLKAARVWHEKGSERIACDDWQANNGQGGALGRWSCPYDKDWFYVAPEWHRMGEHLRLCLWAHPPTEGRLVIQFPQVPLTGRLAGRAGHTLNSSRNARASVELDVTVEPQPPQRLSFDLEDTWRPFGLVTATATTSTVTFAVSSSDAGVNHFCFAADLRETLPAAGGNGR